RARDRGLVAHRNGARKIGGLEGGQDRQSHLGADAPHGLQQPEPFPLDVGEGAGQAALILAPLGLARQRHPLAAARPRLHRARRAVHQIADAADIDDDEVLAMAVDDALELADHAVAILTTALCRWCAWQIAIASASAASCVRGSALGSSTPIIARICAFSPWP